MISPRRYARGILRRSRGKRSQFLIIHAVIYALLGFSYVRIDPPEGSNRKATFSWLPDWLPIGYVGFIWLIAAAVAVYSAVERAVPPRSDRVGFMALVAVPIVWSAMFLISYFNGAETAWVSAATYAGYAAIVIVVSSWPNPAPPLPLIAVPEVEVK